MRILFFGMAGRFSSIPLTALVAAGFDVRAVIVPAALHPTMPTGESIAPLTTPPSRSELPLATRFSRETPVHTAWQHDLPVFAVHRLDDPVTRERIASFAPDVICVACFDRRIPPALLELPAHGWLNVHPSLLPAYRGPAPLFWQMRNGEQEIGVTVHRMDVGLDTGDVLLQERLEVPEGIYGDDLEARCAQIGAGLLVEAVRGLSEGSIIPRPQRAAGASTYPMPTPEDFRIPTDWSARRAFGFIRGVRHWPRPTEIRVAGRRFYVRDAVSYDADRELEQPFVQEHDRLWVQFSPGVLKVILRDEA